MDKNLLIKYIENTANTGELRQVLNWLGESPEHQKELDNLDLVIHASTIAGHDTPAAGPARRKLWPGIVRYAVEFAAVVAVGLFVAWNLEHKRTDDWTAKTMSLNVPAGQHLNIKLQDGSTVWMNSGASIEYPIVFAKNERRVKVSGEVMFDVAYDARQPFIVETYAYDVKVLGTRFEVDAAEHSNDFSTALLRGRVQVVDRKDETKVITLEPNQEVRLVDGKLQLNTLEDLDDYLWTEGLISLRGLTFEELMRKFEKCYGVRIIIDTDKVPQINYNYGKVRISDGVDSVLRLLQLDNKFTYTHNPNEGTIIIR